MEDRPSKTERTNKQRREDALLSLWAGAQTQAGIRQTAWAGYQAVAECVDHVQQVRAEHAAATARAERLLTTQAPVRTKATAWTQFAPA